MSRYFTAANSIAQIQITGDLPDPVTRIAWLAECLASNAFQSIDETADELSYGWVQTDDVEDSTFEAPIAYLRDHYALFTLRTDQRKLSALVLKAHTAKAEKKYLAENPNFRRIPKTIREDIKEKVRLQLMLKTNPVPSFIDVAWDLSTGVATIFSSSLSSLDKFDTAFRKTFEGFHLTLIHPMARAKEVVANNEELLAAVIEADQSNSDAVEAQIKDNPWIGREFLLWLLHRSIEPPTAASPVLGLPGRG